MTVLALSAVATPMHIVQRMAEVAVRGGVFIAFAGMTAVTSHLAMAALESKVRGAVIELDAAPALAVVAVLTLFAEPALVRLVLLVAAQAGAGRVAK